MLRVLIEPALRYGKEKKKENHTQAVKLTFGAPVTQAASRVRLSLSAKGCRCRFLASVHLVWRENATKFIYLSGVPKHSFEALSLSALILNATSSLVFTTIQGRAWGGWL